jgi:hypothetical protein
MAKRNNRGGGSGNDRGVMEMARERPLAAAVAAAGAAAAGLFLWSKRAQISDQLSGLSDQIGEWTDGVRGGSDFASNDDTAGLTTAGQSSNQSRGRRSGGGGGTSGSPSGRGRADSTPTT